MAQLAAFNPVWFFVAWVLIVGIFGKKKKREEPKAPSAPAKPEGQVAASSGPMGELVRALAELKAAEQAARRGTPSAAEPGRHAQAKAYLDARKVAAMKRRPSAQKREVFLPKPRPSLTLEDDQSESLETTDADATDFDEEAERIAAERARAAEEWAREPSPDEQRRLVEKPTTQTAPAETASAAQGRHPLARFATGRVRDVVVLGAILGRPVGER